MLLNIYRIYRYYIYCRDNKIDLYNYTEVPNENAKLGDDDGSLLTPKNMYQRQKSPFNDESEMKPMKKLKKSNLSKNDDIIWRNN